MPDLSGLRSRGVPQDSTSKGKHHWSGVRPGLTPDLGGPWSEGVGAASWMRGSLRPLPRPGAGPRPQGTHLASSSSGVSGHFAAKCAITALDAVAVLEPSRASHSAAERRSSRSPFASPARAIVRRGKREQPQISPLLPVRRVPLPVGGAEVRYSASP